MLHNFKIHLIRKNRPKCSSIWNWQAHTTCCIKTGSRILPHINHNFFLSKDLSAPPLFPFKHSNCSIRIIWRLGSPSPRVYKHNCTMNGSCPDEKRRRVDNLQGKSMISEMLRSEDGRWLGPPETLHMLSSADLTQGRANAVWHYGTSSTSEFPAD